MEVKKIEYLVEPTDILPSPLCTCDNGATYSLVESIFNIVNESKALIKAKNSNALLLWMGKVTALGVDEPGRIYKRLETR